MMPCKQIKWIQYVQTPQLIFSYPTVNSTSRSPCPPPQIRAGGIWMGKNTFIRQLYIYLRTPQRESKQRKETSGHCNCCSIPTPCGKFVLWGDPSSPALPQCADAVQILQDHWITYNFWSTRKFSTSTQPCDSLYCNHNLDERQLQPTKLLEA